MTEAAEHEDWTAPRFASVGGTVSPLVAKVREAIAALSGFDLAKVRPGEDLSEDLGFDDVDRIELAVTLENEFGIEISDLAAEAWVTAGDVAAFVRDCVMRRAAP